MNNRRRKKKQRDYGKSKSETSEKIVSAFEKGGRRDDASVFLRKVAKAKVEEAWAVRAGEQRFTAGLSGNYTMKVVGSFSGGDSEGGVLATVEYKKGPRSMGKDEIELVNADGLKSMLEFVLATDINDTEAIEFAKERLRPSKMAQISPRTFWSLVKLARENVSAAQDEYVEEVVLMNYLRSLVPEHELGSTGRKRELSEKAKLALENERLIKLQKLEEKRLEEELKQAKSAARKKKKEETKKLPSAKELLSALRSQVFKNDSLDLLKKLGDQQDIKSIASLAEFDKDKFISAVKALDNAVDEDTVVGWIETARDLHVKQLFQSIVRDPGLEDKISESLATPFDLARLRVPGRIDYFAEEFGLEKEVLKQWQKQAQEYLQKHTWLRGYRTVG